MSKNMRLKIGRLGEFFIASLEGANIRAISSMNSYMRSQVEIKREPFPTAFKGTLKWFFTGVNQLVSFQFAGLYKCFSTLGTYMNPRTMCVKMLPHRRIISEHLCTTFVRTRNSP